MIALCLGWNGLHPIPVVIKPEDGLAPHGISHGICSECQVTLGLVSAPARDEAYAQYLRGEQMDPRD